VSEPGQVRRSRIDVLGVGVDPIAAKTEVRAWLDEALGATAATGCRHVVTLNPEYVMAARRDRVFSGAIAAADLVTADGVGVAVAARILGGDGAAGLRRCTGLDLCDLLTETCARRAASLFLLGGRDGVADASAAALVRRIPGLTIAGTWEAGSPRPEDDADSLERIGASGARALLVAYGAPGQVLWIARNQNALGRMGVRVAVGVGGSFDILAGRVPRAPRLARRLGLEWLFRLAREPWRWRRQLVLPRFSVLVLVAVANRYRKRLKRR
jgi:N-acetylglucosaminyldiphosphoundecaprenol N-acetyl-beta-D-mannosaminyltransferase